ncbi:hypothetical protein OE88DRAFT_1377674 [Heliocybe sulcata]|uniref:Uncharacterized protein n=1 Tax=Heliocybe sulcata TaxID=5364 RepID=A0A5C3NFD6_9AGAM|nr:hypothetical protein OE88DRAFT_1377674 [Heliocybe sulcata]
MTLSFSPGHGHLSAVDVDWDVHYAQSKTPAVDAAPRVRSRDQTAHVPFGTHYDFTRVTLPSPHSLATLPLPSHNMPKKRPSLQSLFIPSKFLSPSNASSPAHVSHDANASLPATPVPVSLRLRTLSEALRPAHARQESSSSIASSYAGSLHRDLDLSPLEISTPGGSPPAEDLLPDDPFAAASFPSHSPSPSLSASTLPPPLASPALPPPPPPSTPAPHSPLSASFQDRDRPSSMVRRPSLRQSASASILASPKIRPAHTRPAFSPRPSLPSLRVLARTTVMVKKKVRANTTSLFHVRKWDD